MNAKTLGQRLREAIDKASLSPARVAERASTTEATVSNWLNDQVRAENVKAAMLFAIADAAKVDARYLLTGAAGNSALRIAEAGSAYSAASAGAEDTPKESSQPVQLEDWKIAFQLVAEALGDSLTLPPDKHAEVTLLTHDLLVEGMPKAKVLRFVRAAAA